MRAAILTISTSRAVARTSDDSGARDESGDLLAAYAAAPPTLRKAVLKLVQEIAKDHRGRIAEAEDAEAEPRRRVGKR